MEFKDKIVAMIEIVILPLFIYQSGATLWRILELKIDGHIQPSEVDGIVMIYITYLISRDFIKDRLRLIYKERK